jgi:hypothetical protein
MTLPWIPAVTYDTSEVVAFTFPMEPWEPVRGGVGGSAVAASGVGAGFRVRRDRIYRLSFRCWEHELDAVLEWIEWAQDTMQSFDLTFDASDDYTERAMVLVSPVWPDEVLPVRDLEFPAAFRVTIEARTEDGAPLGFGWSEVEE